MTMQLTCISDTGRELLRIHRELGDSQWSAEWRCIDDAEEQEQESVELSIELEEMLNVMDFVYKNTTTTLSVRFEGLDASLFFCVQHIMVQHADYLPEIRNILALFDLRGSGFSTAELPSGDPESPLLGKLVADNPDNVWVTISRSGLDAPDTEPAPAHEVVAAPAHEVVAAPAHEVVAAPESESEPDLSGKFVMAAPSTLQ